MSILQTIDLKKYYGTEPNITRALDGVNFSVNDGEFVAVVASCSNNFHVNINFLFLSVPSLQSLSANIAHTGFSALDGLPLPSAF